MRTYELHSLETLEGRPAASKGMRKFVWSIIGYEEGVWDNCNKLLNPFLDILSPSVGSFCSFTDVLRLKQCNLDEFHSIYTTSRIPYFSFTCNLDKTIYRKGTAICQQCIEQNKTDESGVFGRPTCRADVENTIPTALKIKNAVYALDGRVYATSSTGSHRL